MYRVVLTCWDPGEAMPYADDLSGVKFSLFDTADAAQKVIEQQVKEELFGLNDFDTDSPRDKVAIEDSDGNVVGYDYPFRGDFDSDHAGIIRFWDGDDYKEVTAYNIHELCCDSDDLDKCSYFKYRGFWILPNEKHTSFKVEQFDTTLFKFKSLEDALREIDDFHVILQYSKPSLTSILTKAAIASIESDDTKFNTKNALVEHELN